MSNQRASNEQPTTQKQETEGRAQPPKHHCAERTGFARFLSEAKLFERSEYIHEHLVCRGKERSDHTRHSIHEQPTSIQRFKSFDKASGKGIARARATRACANPCRMNYWHFVVGVGFGKGHFAPSRLDFL